MTTPLSQPLGAQAFKGEDKIGQEIDSLTDEYKTHLEGLPQAIATSGIFGWFQHKGVTCPDSGWPNRRLKDIGVGASFPQETLTALFMGVNAYGLPKGLAKTLSKCRTLPRGKMKGVLYLQQENEFCNLKSHLRGCKFYQRDGRGPKSAPFYR